MCTGLDVLPLDFNKRAIKVHKNPGTQIMFGTYVKNSGPISIIQKPHENPLVIDFSLILFRINS